MEFRNTLPREVDDHPDSGMPRQLRTRADNDPILSRQEADVAGLGRAGAVYGESDADPNRDDQADVHAGAEPV